MVWESVVSCGNNRGGSEIERCIKIKDASWRLGRFCHVIVMYENLGFKYILEHHV